MKKRLVSFALASLICGSVVEARFYLGFDLGYTGAMSYGRGKGMYYGNVEIQDLKYMFKTFSKSDEKGSVKMEPFMGFNTNINFGTENFYLDNYLGFRWGASIGYTTVSQTTEFRSQQSYGTAISSIIEEYNFLDFGLSIDAILNFWNNGAFLEELRENTTIFLAEDMITIMQIYMKALEISILMESMDG